MRTLVAVQWAALERHFSEHAKQVRRFSSADAATVRHMWETQTNDRGKPLSRFERDALTERHCELFGTWPE